MPDRNDNEREKTDPGVVSDRILETVLDLVKEQMQEQARTTKRFMALMLVILVVNAGLSGVNLAVQTMGVNVSTNGDAVRVSGGGKSTTVRTAADMDVDADGVTPEAPEAPPEVLLEALGPDPLVVDPLVVDPLVVEPEAAPPGE